MTFYICVFSFNDKVFIFDLGFVLLSTFVLKEFSNHTPESCKDTMLLRNSHNETETFKIEDHLESFFILFKNSGGLLNEICHIKYFIMMVIEELHKLLYQSFYLLSGAYCFGLIHYFFNLFISRFLGKKDWVLFIILNNTSSL